nr:MAG TPA: hypothetical protein [Caudoviricetes sp.]
MQTVQRAQRPDVCIVPCVVCLAACCVLLFRARWSGRGCTGGVYRERRGWGWVDSLRRKNSKKAFFGVRVANTHPTLTKRNLSDCASLQKFRKKQKDPLRSH